uniref:Protein kinase domain-containing protein n=1 Tax=Globodera rostochiensis TaxID=31243 RepID=A0A914GUG1_GLORO
MDYLQKIRSTVAAQVHSVAAQVSQALPGNPIFREYTIGPQIGSAGPGLCWKIFNGVKNTTKQEVSIWLFEKRQMDNWAPARREEFPEMLKRGVSQLTRLRHPRILTVERALEESRDCFAFCTEPIFACLANCFGDLSNISALSHLKEFELLDLERRHGLYQIAEALAFLHNDTKTVHGNVSPSSILVNSKGAWKLGGFDFCILGNTSTPGKVNFNVPAWSQNEVSAMSPDLDYVSPELAEGVRCDTFVDIFSLGVLSFAAFNNGKPLFNSNNSFGLQRENLKKLKQSLQKLIAIVPAPFGEDVKMCLNETPELRPDAIQFTKLAYFEHPLLKTLNCLEQRSAMDNTQKMQLFKGLPTILTQFPKRTLLQKVFPHLAAEFATPMLIPFILPSVFLLVELISPKEFASSVMPSLLTVFPIQTPYQIALLLMQRVNLLLEKMPTAAVKQHLLPLIYNSLTGDNARIQELTLAEVPNIVKFVDREQMRTQLLPKLLRLVLESRDLSIRVQAMVCLAKLLPHLEPWMVTDQLLPTLPKITSKDPGVLMAVLGIYKIVHESDKFGINKEQCARSVLPFLISTSVEPTLNLQQFSQYIELVHQLFRRVETEQRQCLEQLSASQEKQRKITDFADFLNAQSSVRKTAGSLAVEGADVTAKATLTLEEKRRITAEKNGHSIEAGKTATLDPFSALSTRQSLQQRPQSSLGSSNRMDLLLSEFLPPNSSSAPQTSQQQPHLPQSASFAAFPSIPQPNSSANPVQKRGCVGVRPSAAPKDPFDVLDQLMMNATGTEPKPNEAIGRDEMPCTNGGFASRGGHPNKVEKDPFEDLLR